MKISTIWIATIFVLSLFLGPGTRAQPAADYADAPDGSTTYYPGGAQGQFPTLFSTTNSRVGAAGAHHLTTNQEWLGPMTSLTSVELGVQDAGDPDGVQNLVGSDGFDDGLPGLPLTLVIASLPPQAVINYQISVAAAAPSQARYVNVLIDWNQDGQWNGTSTAPEWAVVNAPVNVTPGSSQYFSSPILWAPGLQLAPQVFWLRITLTRTPIDPTPFSTLGGWDGSGTFAFGETEDYLFLPGLPIPNQTVAPNGVPGSVPAGTAPTIKLIPKSQTISHDSFAVVCAVVNNAGFPLEEGKVAATGTAGFQIPTSPQPSTGPSWNPSGGLPGAGWHWFGPFPGGAVAVFTPEPNLFCGPGEGEIFVIPTTHDISPNLEQVNLGVNAKWTGGGTQSADATVFIHHGGPFGFPLPEGGPGDAHILPILTDPVENFDCTSELSVSPHDVNVDPVTLTDKIAGLVATGAITPSRGSELQSLVEDGQQTPEEINDGQDNDCDGQTDEVDDSVFNSNVEFAWPFQSGAFDYEVARSDDPQFFGCFTFAGPDPFFTDFDQPFPGGAFYYLVRALGPIPGTWGENSNGAERNVFCP